MNKKLKTYRKNFAGLNDRVNSNCQRNYINLFWAKNKYLVNNRLNLLIWYSLHEQAARKKMKTLWDFAGPKNFNCLVK